MKNHINVTVFSMLFILLVSACNDDTDDRNKFIGRYEVTEYSLETYTQRDEYEVRIRKDTGTENMVIITNFYNVDIDAAAAIDGVTITINKQEHSIYEFEGLGRLEGSKIILDYTVTSTEGGGHFDRLRAEMSLIE